MTGPNETGGADTPPATARLQAPGFIGRYHPPVDPGKTIRFISDGQPIKAKGGRAQFLRAMIAAGCEGVCHTEVMPWLLNASDAAKALRDRGVRIDTRKGKPSRWILRSVVQEVQP
jgi:hypothetical protein